MPASDRQIKAAMAALGEAIKEEESGMMPGDPPAAWSIGLVHRFNRFQALVNDRLVKRSPAAASPAHEEEIA